MASASISCQASYSGATRVVTVTLSSDYGSNNSTLTTRSQYTTNEGPYTRIRVDVNGSNVFDTGYCRDFYNFPCHKDKTRTDYPWVNAVGGTSFSVGLGAGHDNVTDASQSGTLMKVTTPSINTPSVSSVNRTTANSSFSVSDNGGSGIVDNYIDCGTTNFGNVVSTISSTSGTFTGLTPNTTYYVRANSSNGYYRGYSSVTSFKTTGNAPSVDSVTTTPGRTSCDFNISASYDTNDSFSSRRIDYGTSTSYGSYVTGTSISSLTPNTTYYYKVTINSSQGRSGTKTGSFTTTGNVPSLGTVYNITQKEFNEFNCDVTYDTNARFSSIEVQWGTDIHYGNTSNNWRIPQSGNTLAHNTTYYYRFRITDNFGRTSSWKTSSFTTRGDAPSVNNVDITDIKSKYVSFDINSTFDTNASFKNCWVMIYLNSTQVYAYTETSASITTRELKPGKNYTIVLRVRDTFDRDGTDYTFDVKTKGGFKFNNKMSDSIKINGKEVIGMKYNGVEII